MGGVLTKYEVSINNNFKKLFRPTGIYKRISCIFSTLSATIPKNSQTHSNISSATADELFELDNFVGLALKGLKLILPTGFYHGFAMSPFCLDQGNIIPMLAFRKSRTSSKFSLQTYHQHNWPSPNFPY